MDLRLKLLLFIALILTSTGALMLLMDPEHNFVAAVGMLIASAPPWMGLFYACFGTYNADESRLFKTVKADREEVEAFI